MKESTQEQLQKMHTAYTTQLQAAIARERAKQQAVQAFLAEFQRVGDDVIRPVMEEFRGFLTTAGNEAYILDEKSETPEEQYQGTGSPFPESAYIALVIDDANLKPEYRQWNNNRVGFAANKDTEQIALYVYGPGGGDPTGAVYRIRDISRDLVEDEVLAGIGRIFAGPPNVWMLDLGRESGPS